MIPFGVRKSAIRCRWQKIICGNVTTKSDEFKCAMISIHSSMLFITVHFSVCFQSVVLVLTSIVSRISYQIETKQKYSFIFVKDEILGFFCAETILLVMQKDNVFFCDFGFFLVSRFSWFGSRITLHFSRGLFVVVLVLARDAVYILELFFN